MHGIILYTQYFQLLKECPNKCQTNFEQLETTLQTKEVLKKKFRFYRRKIRQHLSRPRPHARRKWEGANDSFTDITELSLFTSFTSNSQTKKGEMGSKVGPRLRDISARPWVSLLLVHLLDHHCTFVLRMGVENKSQISLTCYIEKSSRKSVSSCSQNGQQFTLVLS